jgi:hypothetical protein
MVSFSKNWCGIISYNMKRNAIIKNIDLIHIANMIIDDFKELSDANGIDLKVIKSSLSLKKITGIEKRLLSIPSVYIKLSNGKEFIADKDKRLITKVGKDWVYVQDTGWYEWRNE